MKSYFVLPLVKQFRPIVLSALGLLRLSLSKLITVSNGVKNIISTIENVSDFITVSRLLMKTDTLQF